MLSELRSTPSLYPEYILISSLFICGIFYVVYYNYSIILSGQLLRECGLNPEGFKSHISIHTVNDREIITYTPTIELGDDENDDAKENLVRNCMITHAQAGRIYLFDDLDNQHYLPIENKFRVNLIRDHDSYSMNGVFIRGQVLSVTLGQQYYVLYLRSSTSDDVKLLYLPIGMFETFDRIIKADNHMFNLMDDFTNVLKLAVMAKFETANVYNNLCWTSYGYVDGCRIHWMNSFDYDSLARIYYRVLKLMIDNKRLRVLFDGWSLFVSNCDDNGIEDYHGDNGCDYNSNDCNRYAFDSCINASYSFANADNDNRDVCDINVKKEFREFVDTIGSIFDYYDFSLDFNLTSVGNQHADKYNSIGEGMNKLFTRVVKLYYIENVLVRRSRLYYKVKLWTSLLTYIIKDLAARIRMSDGINNVTDVIPNSNFRDFENHIVETIYSLVTICDWNKYLLRSYIEKYFYNKDSELGIFVHLKSARRHNLFRQLPSVPEDKSVFVIGDVGWHYF